MNPQISHHRKPAVVPKCSKNSAHWKISSRAILRFHFREMVRNESESVTEAFNSQLRGGLFIPLSHLSSRPSAGGDKSALMSLKLCWVPMREACSGRNAQRFLPVFSLSLYDLNEALMLCCRTEGPQQPLPVLLCECVATSLLCYIGTSRTIGQVRTISHLTPVFMSNLSTVL